MNYLRGAIFCGMWVAILNDASSLVTLETCEKQLAITAYWGLIQYNDVILSV